MKNTSEPVAVIILGMHRSGTSCLAGSLEMHGLFLGNVNTEAPYNKKGNRENRSIMDLNEKLLNESGGSWDNPPETVVWNKRCHIERSRILSEYPTDKIWGFKDPRTLFTLEGWLEDIPNYVVIGSFRRPDAVAASLNHRNGFDFEKGYELWLYYNKRLLSHQEQMGFQLICFDWPETIYNHEIKRMTTSLRLERTANKKNSFFDASLRHHVDIKTKNMPEAVAATYKNMLDIATNS